MRKGQTTIEALVCVLVFVSALAVFLNSVEVVAVRAEDNLGKVDAKAASLECATLADNLYSNPGSSTGLGEFECYVRDGVVFSSSAGQEMSTRPVNGRTFPANGNAGGIVVEVENHYG